MSKVTSHPKSSRTTGNEVLPLIGKLVQSKFQGLMITPLVELFFGGITLTPKRSYMKFFNSTPLELFI